VVITATTLEVLNGAQLLAETRGTGDAGNVVINAGDYVQFEGISADGVFPSAAFSRVDERARGRGGNVEITATTLEVLNGAQLQAATFGIGDAGDVILRVSEQTLVDDGTITTSALAALGGNVDIESGNLVLRNDGDIATNVLFGAGTGGNITINANFVIALEDSDILAFSSEGTGGTIDLSQTTFFSQIFSLGSERLSQEELLALDGNDRVDINATGGIASGQIFINDSAFIENSLSTLEDTIIDTATLTAGSCIARTADNQGSFTVTGRDGLPQRPGDMGIAAYPTGPVQTVEPSGASLSRMHPTGGTLQEPDGVYQLPDGRLVLSRECSDS
jgi:large exoprotein involved in heme utilization and adhesion